MSSPTFSCGDRIRLANFSVGTGGCLARFREFPERLLLLTAGHAVLTPTAAQGDQILRADTGEALGRLLTWTRIDGDPTADVALIWVDPSNVSPALRVLGMPNPEPASPVVNDLVRTIPKQGESSERRASIRSLGSSMDMRIEGPAWPRAVVVNYANQIWLNELTSDPGDSGSLAVDAAGRAVGMVVGGSPESGTIITPMRAILNNAAWGGRTLEVLDHIPQEAVAPPTPGAVSPAQAEVQTDLKLDWLNVTQQSVARQVTAGLSLAGMGTMLQAAVLANAVAESGLNPLAHNASNEDSVGLFQMNRKGGMGQGRTVEELQRVEVQIAIVTGEINKTLRKFVAATSLDEAVFLFVRDFERPKDPVGETAKRRTIAHRFV